MDDSLRKDVDRFLRRPTDEPPGDGFVSTLYLLRRELQDCLVGTVVEEQLVLRQRTRARLFATVLVVFAGIDLLAKFVSPDARSSDAVLAFLRRFARMKEGDAVKLWQFRNAITHSFGLHHRDETGRKIEHWVFQSDHPQEVVQQRGAGWELSIDDLVEMFINSIGAYQSALETDPALQDAFKRSFADYGMLCVRGPHIVPGEQPRRH